MSNGIKSFEEIMEIAFNDPDKQVSILLGAGFSAGHSSSLENLNIFNSLKESTKMSGELKDLFQKLIKKNERNLEHVLLLLGYGFNIIDYFNGTKYLPKGGVDKDIFLRDTKTIKKFIIDYFRDKKIHPDQLKTNNITDVHVQYCCDKLKRFHRIFTLNYDLILYWLINRINDAERKFFDAFYPYNSKKIMKLSLC